MSKSLQMKIYDSVCADVLTGQDSPDTRLPSRRELGSRGRVLARGAVGTIAVLLMFLLLVQIGASSFLAAYICAGVAIFAALLLVLLKKSVCLPVCLVLGGVVAVVFVFFTLAPAQKLDGCEGTFILRADGREQTEYGSAVIDATITGGDFGQAQGVMVRLFLEDASPENYEAGDGITVYGTAKLTESRSRMSSGSFVNLTQTGEISRTEKGEDTVLCAVTRFSDYLGDMIRQIIPSPREGALLCALITGERGYFDKDFEQALRRSGLAHIAAVSGMHVSVITAIFALLLGKRAGMAASLLFLPLFAAMTGFSPSVLRAVIMGALCSTAFLMGSEYDPLTALAVSAAALTAANPYVLCSASFLLSFCSTFGIITVGIRLSYFLQITLASRSFMQRTIANLCAAFALSVAATMFTLPLQLWLFSSVSTVAAISNLMVVWAVPAAMFFGIILLPLCLIFPAAGGALGFVMALPLRYIVRVVELMGDSIRLTARSDNIFLIAASAGLVVCALVYHLGKIKGRTCAFLCLLLGSLCLCMSWLAPKDALYLYGKDGAAAMVVFDGNIACAVNAPVGYSGQMFVTDTLNGADVQTLVITDPSYHASGASADMDAAEIYSPAPLADVRTLVYTQSGVLSWGKMRAELFYADSRAAMRLSSPRCTLLDVSAVSPFAELPQFDTCDMLVIDAAWASAPAALRYLCACTKPSVVFVSGNVSDTEYISELCECRTVLLDDCGYVKIY